MRLDEFQLAGELPSPVQRAAPIAAPAPAPVAAQNDVSSQEVEQALQNLVDSAENLPDDSPGIDATAKFLETLLSYIPDFQVNEASKTGRSVNRKDSLIKLLGEVFQNIHLLPEEIRDEIVEVCRTGVQMNEALASRATRELSKLKDVEKAAKSYEKTIELDVKGNIAKLDEDIEATAREFANKFNLPIKWARNLIGMFSVKISYEDRKTFLKACLDGEALDVASMIQDGEGRVDDYALVNYPKIKTVYDSVKDTLLDISLSTGQRGATGPFEAMMAIMGGCRKPTSDEGGDLVTKDGLKLEVKATSISPSKDSMNSGSTSSAWLDSTAGKEISGSRLRKEANDWLRDNAPGALTDKEFQSYWKSANFRSQSLGNLKESLVLLRGLTKTSAPGKKLIVHMMSQMFPNVVKLPGYDFNSACTTILNAIGKDDAKTIAREQGVMALLEYIVGKGNDGFVFFNSSTQKFRIIMGVENVIAEARNPQSNLHFEIPMSMGNDAKASPGVYYGARPNSPEGKEYLQKFNSSPERVAMFKKAAMEKEAAKHNKNLALIQAAKEGETTFDFEGKTYPVPKKALKQYWDPES